MKKRKLDMNAQVKRRRALSVKKNMQHHMDTGVFHSVLGLIKTLVNDRNTDSAHKWN